jgi:ribosomal protein S18 acetylase RimI-like enzyme
VRATRLLVLNDLYVDSLQRRKGVAKQLMESAVLVARASNCRGMILETTDDNTSAQLLYEKLGWAEESGVKHYSLDL